MTFDNYKATSFFIKCLEYISSIILITSNSSSREIGKGIPVEKAAVITNIIRRTFFELADAEALELDFRARIDITPEEYLYATRKKAADMEAYTRISAILGGGSKEEIEALGEYGRLLGMMLILRDDLIDIVDFEEAVHRIKKEHPPLPILYALQNPEIKSTLSPILLKKTIRKKDAKAILEITGKAGGLKNIGNLLQEMVENAYRQVENLKQNKKSFRLIAQSIASFYSYAEKISRANPKQVS